MSCFVFHWSHALLAELMPGRAGGQRQGAVCMGMGGQCDLV